MSDGFQACYRYLQKKHIRVQNEWLEACIEWIIEENGRKLPGELCNLVYEQWLMADLCEISESSFPKNIHKIKGNFSGNFCVQIMSIIDIGHSAYSQLQKHKGQELDYDDHADEEEENEAKELNEAKEFFKKSLEGTKMVGNPKNKWSQQSQTRMLHFKLHDGVQTIEGIEYSPIKKLELDKIEPGCKLFLSGKIRCRDSILLLTSENVEFLGGNVEGLMESNSQFKSIITKLKIKEEDSGTTAKKINKTIIQNNKSCSSKALQEPQVKTKDLTNSRNIHKSGTKTQNSSSNPTNKHALSLPKKEDNYFEDNIDHNFMKNIDEDLSNKLNDDIDDIFFHDVDITSSTKSSYIKDASEIRKEPVKKAKSPTENDIGDYFDNNEDIDIFNVEDNFREQSHPKTAIENNDISNNFNFPENTKKIEDNQEAKDMTIKKMTSRNLPVFETFKFKGYFKTLASKLSFSDGNYELFAVLADDDQFLKVLLSDKALCPVIGFTAQQVKAAIANQMPKQDKEKIKQALRGAEKALEMNKWNMTIEFNKNENIYEILSMEPDFFN